MGRRSYIEGQNPRRCHNLLAAKSGGHDTTITPLELSPRHQVAAIINPSPSNLLLPGVCRETRPCPLSPPTWPSLLPLTVEAAAQGTDPMAPEFEQILLQEGRRLQPGEGRSTRWLGRGGTNGNDKAEATPRMLGGKATPRTRTSIRSGTANASQSVGLGFFGFLFSFGFVFPSPGYVWAGGGFGTGASVPSRRCCGCSRCLCPPPLLFFGEEEPRKNSMREVTPTQPTGLDGQILVHTRVAWRVKGIIQVSRTIGDVYLKEQEYSMDPVFRSIGPPIPLKQLALSAEPSIQVRKLKPNDMFLIFASDGP
uniref:protein-serine/threonine phosphatase n=2 Tax=Oryza TaxID=4527 RepID=A0A0E0GFU9_ORYNI